MSYLWNITFDNKENERRDEKIYLGITENFYINQKKKKQRLSRDSKPKLRTWISDADMIKMAMKPDREFTGERVNMGVSLED